MLAPDKIPRPINIAFVLSFLPISINAEVLNQELVAGEPFRQDYNISHVFSQSVSCTARADNLDVGR